MGEPEDPFKQNEVEAKVMFDLMQSYMDAGFRRAEAFQLLLTFASIGAAQSVQR